MKRYALLLSILRIIMNVPVYGARKEMEMKALNDATQAIKLAPKNALNYLMRAAAWEMKSDWDKALSDYSEGLRLNSSQPDLRYRRGNLWVHLGVG